MGQGIGSAAPAANTSQNTNQPGMTSKGGAPVTQQQLQGMTSKGGAQPVGFNSLPQRPPMGMGGQMPPLRDNFERINSEMYAREQANAGQPSVAMNRFGQVAPQYGQIPQQYGGFGQPQPGMGGKGNLGSNISYGPRAPQYGQPQPGMSLSDIESMIRGAPQQTSTTPYGQPQPGMQGMMGDQYKAQVQPFGMGGSQGGPSLQQLARMR
jgi:hypothetical protein